MVDLCGGRTPVGRYTRLRHFGMHLILRTAGAIRTNNACHGEAWRHANTFGGGSETTSRLRLSSIGTWPAPDAKPNQPICRAYLYQFILSVGEDAEVLVQLFDTVGTHSGAHTRLGRDRGREMHAERTIEIPAVETRDTAERTRRQRWQRVADPTLLRGKKRRRGPGESQHYLSDGGELKWIT